MARAIFWGVFSLIVLYACVTLINFSTSSRIDEALRDAGSTSMPVAPYAQEMIRFFNAHRRWPTQGEITLPKPPVTGIVHSVTLEPDGVLALKLRGLVWLQRPQVRVALILQPGPEQLGWTSACLDASPSAIVGLIFVHCSRTTLADVQETQREVISIQDRDL